MTISHTTVLCVLATACSVSAAQPFTIDSFTIDGGGTLSSGGSFELVGTIGQPETGAILSGSAFELTGGFWGGAASQGCNIADLAPPFGTLDFTDVVSFLIGFSAADPAADLAPPFGVFDFTDIVAFLNAFGAGCP